MTTTYTPTDIDSPTDAGAAEDASTDPTPTAPTRRRHRWALIAGGAAVVVGLAAVAGSRTGHPAPTASRSFCDQLADAATLSQTLGNRTDASAEDLARVADAFVALDKAAPADIRPELSTVTNVIVALSTAPDDDPVALQAAVDQALTPEFISATEAVGTYAETECGIVPPAYQ
jgi:hypothetical protein